MAAFDFDYEGLRTAGTFPVASATKAALKGKPQDIIGKVVTITGNHEVGYGSDKAVPLGVVTQVEPYAAGSEQLVVTVNWGQTFTNIPCTTGDKAGNYLLCDGKGGLKKVADTTVTNCKALAVTEQLADIKID